MGFEPTTSCMPCKRSQLSYGPVEERILAQAHPGGKHFFGGILPLQRAAAALDSGGPQPVRFRGWPRLCGQSCTY